eukprot:gene18785-26771_t
MADIASFKKMLKAGVPRGAVELRCQAAGLDPALLDQFLLCFGGVRTDVFSWKWARERSRHLAHSPPNAPFNDFPAAPAMPAGGVDGLGPEYRPFLMMMKAGVPQGAVDMKCQMAGLDPARIQNGKFLCASSVYD